MDDTGSPGDRSLPQWSEAAGMSESGGVDLPHGNGNLAVNVGVMAANMAHLSEGMKGLTAALKETRTEQREEVARFRGEIIEMFDRAEKIHERFDNRVNMLENNWPATKAAAVDVLIMERSNVHFMGTVIRWLVGLPVGLLIAIAALFGWERTQ